MDPVMQALCGKTPISYIPSVQSAISIKNRNKVIAILSVALFLVGTAGYYLLKKHIEMKKEKESKEKEKK